METGLALATAPAVLTALAALLLAALPGLLALLIGPLLSAALLLTGLLLAALLVLRILFLLRHAFLHVAARTQCLATNFDPQAATMRSSRPRFAVRYYRRWRSAHTLL
jgi:hypothetical protein